MIDKIVFIWAGLQSHAIAEDGKSTLLGTRAHGLEPIVAGSYAKISSAFEHPRGDLGIRSDVYELVRDSAIILFWFVKCTLY